tara:strand:+ start:1231 stop:1485 length:255 start_codon:yes stop_codon:yes gene_type:complete
MKKEGNESFVIQFSDRQDFSNIVASTSGLIIDTSYQMPTNLELEVNVKKSLEEANIFESGEEIIANLSENGWLWPRTAEFFFGR